MVPGTVMNSNEGLINPIQPITAERS